MKKRLSLLLLTSLILAGCSGSSSGVTTEPDSPSGPVTPNPTPTPGTSPTPQPTPAEMAFSWDHSELKFYNINNEEIKHAGIGNEVRVKFTARDIENKLKSRLNVTIHVGFKGTWRELLAFEESPGVYTSSTFISDSLGTYESIPSVNFNLQTSGKILRATLDSSFCYNPNDPSAAPYYSQQEINSETYNVICGLDQFALIANPSNSQGRFLIGKDLDFKDYYKSKSQFKIGSTTTPFKGKVLGGEYSVINFTYNSESEDNVGVFGVIGSGAVVKEIGFSGLVIKGRNNVGIIGKAETSQENITVESLKSDYSNSITALGDNWSGGIGLALAESPSYVVLNKINTFTSIDFTSQNATQSFVGGIVGQGKRIRMQNSESFSKLTSVYSNQLLLKVGGFIGSCVECEIDTFKGNSSLAYKRGEVFGGFSGRLTRGLVKQVRLESFIDHSTFTTTPASTENTSSFTGLSDAVNFSNISVGIDTRNISGLYGGISSEDSGSSFNTIDVNGTVRSLNSKVVGGVIGVANNSSMTKVQSWVSLTSENKNAEDFVGGITGNLNSASISQSAYFGMITYPDASFVGGIAGSVANSSVTNTFNMGILLGANAGGLVGKGVGVSISNSYSTGSILASQNAAGIIVQSETGSVTNSFSTSTVNANQMTTSGSIIGSGPNNTVTGAYYFSRQSNLNACGQGVNCASAIKVVSDDYFKSATNDPVKSWDFTNIWTFRDPGTFPYLKL